MPAGATTVAAACSALIGHDSVKSITFGLGEHKSPAVGCVNVEPQVMFVGDIVNSRQRVDVSRRRRTGGSNDTERRVAISF